INGDRMPASPPAAKVRPVVPAMRSARASSAFLRRAAVDLLVRGLGDLLQTIAFGRSADHVGEVAVDPIERGVAVARGVTQRSLRIARVGAVERKALAGRGF